jgi:hypothetical protein
MSIEERWFRRVTEDFLLVMRRVNSDPQVSIEDSLATTK